MAKPYLAKPLSPVLSSGRPMNFFAMAAFFESLRAATGGGPEAPPFSLKIVESGTKNGTHGG